jgi:hypothetical protein
MRNKISRLAAAGLITLAIPAAALATGLATASTASASTARPASAQVTHSPTQAAAVGCYAASCNGQDPHQMGCDQDATTIDQIDTSEGTVLLRWSNTCQANWTTVNNVSIFGINFWVENKAGSKQSYGWGFAGPASGWSNMVNGHNILARACDDNGCTGWH